MTGGRGDVHLNRLWLICRKYKHAVDDICEDGWRNDQRPPHFARHGVNGAILRVHDVTQCLVVDLENYLDRNGWRILGEADKLLIVDSKRAERSAFAKPVRLRIRDIV